MNALVRSNLERLAEAVGQMAKLVESAHAQIEEHAVEKEQATFDNWSKDTRVAVLEENLGRMDEVMKENKRLREKHAQAVEHAARLLAHVRELQGKFTP